MAEKRFRLWTQFCKANDPMRWCKWGVTGAQGWAMVAWSLMNETSLFGGRSMASDGYIAQEIERILERRKKNG